MRAIIVVLLFVSCAGASDEPVVFAAASLTDVFRQISPEARFNFAGSDSLASQIREGAQADVFASASPRHADRLSAEGLIDDPRVFATNRVVLIVPRRNPACIESVGDLRRSGVRLVIGAPGVPVGDYARALLRVLDAEDALDNVVTEEQDVKGVLGKVALGEADAGFVYATDLSAAPDDVVSIDLPDAGGPEARYVIAAVSSTKHPSRARSFIRMVLGERGRSALRSAGFGVP